MARRLEDVRLAVLMLDGLEIADRTHVVALGITTDGVKARSGSGRARPRTPRSRVRCWPTSSSGLDPEQAILVVIDGARGAAQSDKEATTAYGG